uniref:Uncharacterized protein n=1 Tax=Cacopsylla melanoneura TaxID=428564 RepID=A0A8D8T587_9HEMI
MRRLAHEERKKGAVDHPGRNQKEKSFSSSAIIATKTFNEVQRSFPTNISRSIARTVAPSMKRKSFHSLKRKCLFVRNVTFRPSPSLKHTTVTWPYTVKIESSNVKFVTSDSKRNIYFGII